MNGQVIYKVYDESDTFLGVLNDVVPDLAIPNAINSTGTALEITLARNADSVTPTQEPYLSGAGATITTGDGFPLMALLTPQNQIGPGSMINENNIVRIVSAVGNDVALLDDNGDPLLTGGGEEFIASVAGDGVAKFTGFISNISSNYGGSENTVITVTSFGYDLDQYVIESGGFTKVAFTSDDPSDILRDVLDLYQASAGSWWINYDSSTIEDTGTSVSYTFNTNTTKEGVQKAVELAPADWYYYLDVGTNLLYFKERPSTPDHYFYLGKHIEQLDVDSSILDVVNDTLFTGGEVAGENLLVRQTAAPAARTRRGLRRLNDGRVLDTTTADLLATSENDRYNKILYTSTITIMAADYNINDIAPGDLVGFRNFNNYVDDLQLQVVRTKFMLDRIELELGTLLPRISKRIEDIKRNLTLAETANNQDQPS